jgi:hypothetical protein
MQCPCSSTTAAHGANHRSNGTAPPQHVIVPEGLGSKAVKPSAKKRFQYNDLDFVAFWEVYPKKRGKEDAWAAWCRVIASGVEAQQVIAAASRYAAAPDRDPAKTKYPQGWLSGGRWLDEPDAVSHPAAAVDPDFDFDAQRMALIAEEDRSVAALLESDA